jgi:hypothetical protein
MNLLEETLYGLFLKSDDDQDQTRLEPPHTNDGMQLHSLAMPLETKFSWPLYYTVLFSSIYLGYLPGPSYEGVRPSPALIPCWFSSYKIRSTFNILFTIMSVPYIGNIR